MDRVADPKTQEHTTSVEVLRRRQQNRSSPINRLPDELLSEIFLEFRDLILENSRGLSKYPNYQFASKGLVDLLHVCHDWRSTATLLPHLWTRIHAGPFHPEWTRKMLNISQPCPLTVYSQIFPENQSLDLPRFERHRGPAISEAIALIRLLVQKCVEDLKELRVRGIFRGIVAHVFDHQVSAELLKTLRIASPPTAADAQKTFMLTDEVLVAPALENLSLVCCGIDWKSRLLRNLTQLRIFDLPEDQGVSFPDFLSAISQIPHLKALTFYGSFDGEVNEKEANTFIQNRIKLDYLQSLYVHFKVDFLSNFLLCIDVPPTTVIKVGAFRDEGTPVALASYFFSGAYLALAHIAKGQSDIRSLRISEMNNVGFRFQTFHEALSHDEMKHTGLRPRLDVAFIWGNGMALESQTFAMMVGFRNVVMFMMIFRQVLQKLVYLEIAGQDDLGSRFWIDSFSSLTALRSILLDTPSEGFFDAFSGCGTTRTTTRSGFTGLQAVVCGDKKQLLSRVRDALDKRDQSGMPLEHLWLPSEIQGDNDEEIEMSRCKAIFQQDEIDILEFMDSVEAMDSEDEADEEYGSAILA